MSKPSSDTRTDRVTVPVRVRYAECDPMQIAHHASYPVWMEIGRTELLRAQGANYRDCEASGVFFAVARMNIRYKKPACYDDELELLVIGLPCAGVKVEHLYELRRGEELLMTAETTIVCVTAEGRAVPVPKGLLP
ncbi:MAG: acyl-CoA thioesterase [Phycisphaeraceae bacterium]|nr:acyl-CoA thioesterase [Phycisphaeraceae bacterium]